MLDDDYDRARSNSEGEPSIRIFTFLHYALNQCNVSKVPFSSLSEDLTRAVNSGCPPDPHFRPADGIPNQQLMAQDQKLKYFSFHRDRTYSTKQPPPSSSSPSCSSRRRES